MIRQRNFKSNQVLRTDDSNLALGVEEIEQLESKQTKQLQKELKTELDFPSGMSSMDLKQLTVLKNKLKAMNSNSKEADFVSNLDNIVEYLEDIQGSERDELVLFVMFKIERFILSKHSGEQKLNIAVQLLKRLFHGDSDITESMVNNLMHKHKQIKTIGRIGIRIYRFFLKKE